MSDTPIIDSIINDMIKNGINIAVDGKEIYTSPITNCACRLKKYEINAIWSRGNNKCKQQILN